MKKFEKWVCLIVDAYSTGKYLAPALKGRGYQSIHIQSSANLPSQLFSCLHEDFIDHFTYSGDLSNLLKVLKKYHIKLCVPGSESGVELADLLSEALNLPSNGSEYSLTRRNKYWMAEAVNKAGLNTIKQMKSKDRQEIINWIQSNAIQFPIVLKALDSASNNNVHFCENIKSIAHYHQKILESCNLFGEKNQEVLAQNYVDGQEYIVNTVSWGAKHALCEIWRVHKKVGTIIYDYAEIVHPDENEYHALFDYTKKILNALNIKYGAGTTEIKLNSEGKLVLIESAARLMGNAPLSFSTELFGFNQLSLMVDAYLDPSEFLERINRPLSILKNHGMTVVLNSNCSGRLQADLAVEQIKKLNSVHGFIINGSKGNVLNKTINILTSPGEVYLINADQQKMLSDYEKIRQIENDGLYTKAINNQHDNQVPDLTN